ncbi:MAG TPA: hypothetical protein VGF86_07340 [Candidatus Tumulicola sp.]
MTASRFGAIVFAAVTLAAAVPAGAVTTSPTVRHVVYSFTWGNTSDTEVHTSGMSDSSAGGGGGAGAPPGSSGNASGIASYGGGTGDKGTISVDFVRQQPDGGLVVSVAEQALERRSAPAATCVVYGDLTVVCDPNKKINAEELTLLRLLGANFVDPNALDAKRHWQRVQTGATTSSVFDFTIAKNANGIMTIDETSTSKDSSGGRPLTTEVNGTIGYDFGRTLPTSIDEYAIVHSEQGEQYQTIKTQTVLRLQSDTAKP